MPDVSQHAASPNSSSNSAPAKKRFVSDLVQGDEVADLFVLATAQQGQARNGPYWRLEFQDASGGIGGKIWSPQSQTYPDLAPGMLVWAKGRVVSYRERLELAVENLRVLEEQERAPLDLALFMPASPFHPDAMQAELLDLARKTLTHKPWRKFIVALLTDAAIAPLLRLAPAAKAMHHAYASGLLEHTLSVAKLCLRIADQYPQLDRQTLFAGAVCHDLGKIWELNQGLGIDYTTTGRLAGHIVLSLEKLAPFLKKSGLEPDLVEHLQHLIVSHHGTHEFGSPRLPSSAEALALHFADDLDAKLQQVQNALAGVEEGGWSGYSVALERFLFCARRTPESMDRNHASRRKQEEPSHAKTGGLETAPASGKASAQLLPLFDLCSLPLKE